jgi:hypothetical protein
MQHVRVSVTESCVLCIVPLLPSFAFLPLCFFLLLSFPFLCLGCIELVDTIQLRDSTYYPGYQLWPIFLEIETGQRHVSSSLPRIKLLYG